MRNFTIFLLFAFSNNKAEECPFSGITFYSNQNEASIKMSYVSNSSHSHAPLTAAFPEESIQTNLSKNPRVKQFCDQIAINKGKNPSKIDWFYSDNLDALNAGALQKRMLPWLSKDKIIISKNLYDLLIKSLENNGDCSYTNLGATVTMSCARVQAIITAIFEHELTHLQQPISLSGLEATHKTFKNGTQSFLCLAASILLYKFNKQNPQKMAKFLMRTNLVGSCYSFYKWAQGTWHKINKTSHKYEFDADDGVSESLYILESFRLFWEIQDLIMLHKFADYLTTPIISSIRSNVNSAQSYFTDKKSVADLDELYNKIDNDCSHPSNARRRERIQERIKKLKDKGLATPYLSPVKIEIYDHYNQKLAQYILY